MHYIHDIATLSLRKLKVGTRLLLFLSLSLLFILSTTFLVVRHFSLNITNQYLYGYLQSEHKRVANNIDLYLEEVIMISLHYKNNGEFYSIMKDEKLSVLQKEKELQSAAAALPSPLTGSVSNVYLIDFDKNIYPLRNDNTNLPLPDLSILPFLQNTSYYQIGSVFKDAHDSAYLPLSMKFYNFNTGQSIGYLIFYLPEKPIAELYSNLLTNTGVSFIVDSSNHIISHSDGEQIGQVNTLFCRKKHTKNISDITIDQKHSVLIVSPLNSSSQNIGFSWSLVSILTYRQLYQILDHVLAIILATAVIVLLIAFFLSFAISRGLTKPLRRLELKIRDLANGQLDAFMKNKPADELWELEQGYNEMVLRINDLIERNRLEQEKKQELEFIALQAQINPHFLYNTLDAIGWIARLKEQPEIERMVIELSNFFRLSLHRGDKRITIEDEIGIAASYVNIEQMRNPGKFQVTYDIPSEIKQILVPKIILQPLVENAIKHGVSQVRRPGSIQIAGYREGDHVYLEVIDNGAGFTVIKGSLPSSSKGSGYGLRNVKERLQLEYGEMNVLEIWSEKGSGTRVRLHLFIKDDPNFSS